MTGHEEGTTWGPTHVGALEGHSRRRGVTQGRSQLVPRWEELQNGGGGGYCKVSFILPFLWSLSSPLL